MNSNRSIGIDLDGLEKTNLTKKSTATLTSAELVDYKRREAVSPDYGVLHQNLASLMKRLAKVNFCKVYGYA